MKTLEDVITNTIQAISSDALNFGILLVERLYEINPNITVPDVIRALKKLNEESSKK